MGQEQLTIFLIFFALAMAVLYYAIHLWRAARKIKDTPGSKIASAPQGYVEVEGFAWPVDQCSRLASGREVVHYSCMLQRKETRGSGKNRRTEWVPVWSCIQSHPFYVVDSTGLASIDLHGCKFSMDAASIRSWRSLNRAEKDRLLGLIGDERISRFPPSEALGGLFSTPYQVIENEIFVGSPLYLQGDFRTPSAELPTVSPHGLAEFHRRVFPSDARSGRNVVVFLDKNKDGKISEKEAQAGYSLAASMALRKSATEGAREFKIHGVMGSSEEHRLLIADAHQEHLAARLERRMLLPIVAAVLLLGAGFWLLAFGKVS